MRLRDAKAFERKLCRRLLCGQSGWTIPDQGTTNLVAGFIGFLAVAPWAIGLAVGGGAGGDALEAAGLTAVEGQQIADEIAAAEGAASDTVVLGHYPEYVNTAEQVGGRSFQVPEHVWESMTPEEQWTANQKFLDRAIARGSDISLATPADAAREGSFFERELQYLESQGYKVSSDGRSMIRPGG
jgi:hypothetical protein